MSLIKKRISRLGLTQKEMLIKLHFTKLMGLNGQVAQVMFQRGNLNDFSEEITTEVIDTHFHKKSRLHYVSEL